MAKPFQNGLQADGADHIPQAFFHTQYASYSFQRAEFDSAGPVFSSSFRVISGLSRDRKQNCGCSWNHFSVAIWASGSQANFRILSFRLLSISLQSLLERLLLLFLHSVERPR